MMSGRFGRALIGVALGTLLPLSLVACSGGKQVFPQQRDQPGSQPTYTDTPTPTIFSKGGLGSNLFGGGSQDSGSAQGGTSSPIPVNAFLWRATLDTVSFMPLASADPFGGVILTDWYSPPQSANERFKLSIFILDRDLRSDGIRVSVFRQTRDDSGTWSDTPPDPKTASSMENAILTRASQLRQIATAATKN